MAKPNFYIRAYTQVKAMLQKSHVLVEVVDSRDVSATRLEDMETKFHDKLLIAAAKSDISGRHGQAKLGRVPLFHLSSKTGEGVDALRAAILAMAHAKMANKEPPITIFFFGMPNVGKSSLINRISGRKAAKTGFRSGITRSIQWIALAPDIRIIDAPGVVEKNTSMTRMAMSASIDAQKIKNPQREACKIVELFVRHARAAELFAHYGIEGSDDPEVVLDQLARRRKKMLKGGEFDLDEAARILIRDWQKGTISLPAPKDD